MTRPHPQRIFAPSRPGSLLKRVGAAAPKAEPVNDDRDYLEKIRACACLKCGMTPSEAAHVRYASAAHGKASGMGKKPELRFCVPLCSQCHRLAKGHQHSRSEQSFWHEIDINPLIVAAEMYARRGDLVAMQHVVIHAIAVRVR